MREIVDRSINRCLLLVLTLCLGMGSAWASKDSVPDWVRTAAQLPVPHFPPDTDAVILLDDTTFTVTSDGRAVEHRRRVLKILRPQGREKATVVVPFDADRKLLSLHVWSIGPDGHEYAVKDNEVLEFGYPGEGEYYQDERYKIVEAPGRDPGGIVAYEAEQRMPSYINEKDWVFQQEIPSLSRTFTLEIPPGYSYETSWAHAQPIAPVDLEHQHWKWEARDVPGINLEQVPMHPSGEALAGRMTLHFSGPGVAMPLGNTWQSIGEWYSQLAKDRLVASPEMAAKANELVAGKTDFVDRSEAIAEFVQKQVRYFVIEMGIGGWQPHPAADIFRNRYGDCKDKATLLSAMLSAVDIHSTLVLVDTRRGVVDPDAPSMFGNHMIAAIEIPKGYDSPRLKSVVTSKAGRRYLIFDPTWEKTAFGQLEHGLQGGYGLLAEGSESQVIQFPVLSPALNTIHRRGSFQLQEDGSLQGSITETRFGDLSEYRRELYATKDAKEQQDFLDRVLQRDFTNFSVSDVKVANVDAFNKELSTTYSLHAERFGTRMGSLLMVRPRVFGDEGLEFDHKARTVPVDLKQSMQEQDDYSVQLPTGYVADDLPEPVNIDVGFASYQSSTRLEGNTLHYTRTYTVREVTLPADRYADYRKLAETIGADEESRAVLKKQ